MKHHRLISITIAAVLVLPSCMKDDPIQITDHGNTPVSVDDGWTVSDPVSEGMDATKLDELYETLFSEELYPNLQSLLIIRNGKLVAEAYFKDIQDRQRTHAVMSVTKSITSLVAGISFDKGWLDSPDSPAFNYIPEYFDQDTSRRGITLHHLLTMEAGLDFDNEVHTHQMIHHEGSSLAYVLSRPMVFSPGDDWYYGDGNPQLISGIIARASGASMEQIAADYLFGPLGITDYFWESHSDGLSLGGMGLWLRPRDMARIGQLMLNNGNWEGEQVVSSEWVSKSTTRRAENRDYGYYWLTSENRTYWASGTGGQIIWIYPEKSLVVVVTSDSYARSWKLSSGSYDTIFQAIYESLIL